MCYNKEGVLKGLVTLHVDDMMIGGDHRDQDFSDALERIKKSFDFGKWAVLDVKNPMVFCGGRIQVTAQKELTLDYEEFFKKVLPINIVKNRNMNEPLNASEINTRAETKRRSEVSERTLTVEQRQQFIEAKVEELNSYFKNAVWTFAEPGAHGTGRVTTARWVLTWKRVDEGNDSNPRYKAKARLVLRGFQDPDLAHLDKACKG